MAKWTKNNIFESFDKVVYDDEFGYGVMPKVAPSQFQFVIKDKIVPITDLFVKKDDNYIRLDCDIDRVCKILFDEPLYICSSYINKTFEKASIDSIVINCIVKVLKRFEDIALPKKLAKYDFNKTIPFSDIKKTDIYVFDGSLTSGVLPVLYNGEKGDKCFYLGVGVAKICETFDSIEKDKPVCIIEVCENQIEIMPGDANLVFTPDYYDLISRKERTTFLTRQFNGNALMLVAMKNEDANDIMFMWQKHFENVNFVIEIYKVLNVNDERRSYLVTHNIPNGECFYLLKSEEIKTVGLDSFIRLTAINQKGDLVAFSKGVDIGTLNFSR